MTMLLLRFGKAFQHAAAGIIYALRSQRNMTVHVTAAGIVLIMAWRLHLARSEVLMLVVAVTLVIMAELFNTAIESVVDLISPGYHPQAKIAKDVAAGAVLIAAIMAVIIGIILFVPRLC
ncbi:prokaryotic diacylglycerol kinase [Lucifera butyrica]|uniref:Prokaryotic diacylglycerol kinase n=1 Tax=Lucifera butyrica TaxID=1351585 RepID=A0A498R3T7_9FIRM|nr:diacylglycerol kinase family protein [Lucifera butyrica]VBB06081.1 prokaryotic diacylglycerol kinase [Lucifera butyrica]